MIEYFSPGRINLIGEHIDYNGGLVLPTAINLGTKAKVTLNDSGYISLFSNNIENCKKYKVKVDENFSKTDTWTDYLLSVVAVFKDHGYNNRVSFDIVLESDLPHSAGLSSSACIEVLMANILNDLNNFKINDKQLAIYAREAETKYIGVNCGIMDQFIIANGKKDHALILNTSNLEYSSVKIPISNYNIVVINSNKRRELVDSEYNTRTNECTEGLSIIKKSYDVDNICDISVAQLKLIEDNFPKNVYKRVYHAVSEQERVIKSIEAIKENDIEKLANYINESHISLRDNFEVSCKELNFIADESIKFGAIGARMVGAGFGGCAIALVAKNKFDDYKKLLEKSYKSEFNIDCDIFNVSISNKCSKVININEQISSLTNYYLKKGYITTLDINYCMNQIGALLNLEEIKYIDSIEENLYDSLSEIISYATDNNIIEDYLYSQDILESNITNIFLNKPSIVQSLFDFNNCNESAMQFYNMCVDSNYIKLERLKRNINFKKYVNNQPIEISINLAKPEKTTEEIALLKNQVSNSYPKCLLCAENVGFNGTLSKPARSNHRVISMDLNNQNWLFQYSPYSYYDYHCILIEGEHNMMEVTNNTIEVQLDFVDKFTNFFIGNNASLPIIGGSILNHNHFQGGIYNFPIDESNYLYQEEIEDVNIQYLDWHLSTIKLQSKSRKNISKIANTVFNNWKNYENTEVNIYNREILHNSVNFIARKNDDVYTVYIILRNNHTNEKYPNGIYHIEEQYYNIKKENIGLIEAMGLAILPGRLLDELDDVKKYILDDYDISNSVHYEWSRCIKKMYNNENIDEFIEENIAMTFINILKCCNVFKFCSEDQSIDIIKELIKERI